MGAGNKVVLTFAGDSSDLERSFERIGSSARTMGRDAPTAIDRIGTASTRAGRTAKGLQGALGGAVASGQGLAMIAQGDVLNGLLQLEGGFGRTALSAAKLAKNFAATAVQFVANSARMVASMATTVATTVAGWVLMGVQALINAAKMAVAWLISLGPIGLVIAAIGAVIAILLALGIGFDDIKRFAMIAWEFILGAIQGVFNWVKTNWPLILAILTGPIGIAVLLITRNWDTIKNGFTAVKDWIAARIGDIVGFITGLPGRIASAASGMFDGITDAFKSAINAIIGLWNNFSISFGGFDIPGPGPNIPSFTIDTPNIPFLAKGGIVTRPTVAMIGEAGPEAVVPLRGGMAGGTTVKIYVQGSIRSDRDLVKIIRDEFDRGGFRGLM